MDCKARIAGVVTARASLDYAEVYDRDDACHRDHESKQHDDGYAASKTAQKQRRREDVRAEVRRRLDEEERRQQHKYDQWVREDVERQAHEEVVRKCGYLRYEFT